MAKKEKLNMETGELTEDVGQLNVVIIKETIRPDGSRRIQQDFTNCPTLAEQHTAHLTNINYLIAKYKPDELAAYIAARNVHRQEILGHDFSREPDLQTANNIIYESKQRFNNLPEEVKNQFGSHLEFLKYIDNTANAATLIKLGIITPEELKAIQIPEPGETSTTRTTTQEEDKEKKK